MKRIMLSMCSLVLVLTAGAQTVELKSAGRAQDYVQTILDRSTKNISALELKGEKAEAVRNIVANRYFELNDIYAERDTMLKSVSNDLPARDKHALKEGIRQACDSKLYRSHFAFPTQLGIYLTPEQVTMVMDAITYNKVKVTYDAYLDEIPSLTKEEKTQIYAWLCEARDLAVDAENSKQKHETFNKYKGRINNYLSKRGYDLNKEREEWFKRIKAREEAEKKKKK